MWNCVGRRRARDKQLDESLASAASFQLHAAPWPEIKGEAVKLFPLPPAKDRALPPIADLLKMKGDVVHVLKDYLEKLKEGKIPSWEAEGSQPR